MKIHRILGFCIAILFSLLILVWAQEDRVGFPSDYETNFKLYHAFNRKGRPQLREMWINPVGTNGGEGKSFPYGTMIVMATYMAKGQDGEILIGKNGLYVKDELRRIDVMRKEKGYGEKYGKSRSGEWEFNSYDSDGELQSEKTTQCAKCHMDASNTDFVFTAKELFKK